MNTSLVAVLGESRDDRVCLFHGLGSDGRRGRADLDANLRSLWLEERRSADDVAVRIYGGRGVLAAGSKEPERQETDRRSSSVDERSLPHAYRNALLIWSS
jgi:hypothetical protein